jgi:hypothetical protein
MCCSKGNITMGKWKKQELDSENEQEEYAARIHDLWKEDSMDGRLLREFARPLNNALAFASQIVEEKNTLLNGQQHRQQHWMPNVVIKGKLFHKMSYSLRPPEGVIPRFVQIYVYDPEQDEGAEANIRLGHMRLSSGTTAATRDKLISLLTRLQGWLRRCNNYVQDFIHVCEIPSDEVETMQLVITPKVKLQYDHSGVYNLPTGFKEVQILMDDSLAEIQHSIVVRQRRADGPLQYISDIHRSFDPLHYPLLFPEGEDSWYAGMSSSLDLTGPHKN